MKKLESTLRNMMLSLTSITAIAAVALAGVDMLTKDTIASQKEIAKQNAIAAVLPAYDHLSAPDTIGEMVVYKGFDAAEQYVGAAVQTVSDGFGGKIKLMVGFDANNIITNYSVLEQTETPGLGTHIVEWFKSEEKPSQNIIGREVDERLRVSKDGGEVDAITAATISSRAFLKAVHAAYAVLADADADAMSGATRIESTQPTMSEEAETEETSEFVTEK